MNKEQFIAETKKLGINLTEEQLNKLDQFYNYKYLHLSNH